MSVPSGWYRDPSGSGRQRRWDGAAWLPSTRATGVPLEWPDDAKRPDVPDDVADAPRYSSIQQLAFGLVTVGVLLGAFFLIVAALSGDKDDQRADPTEPAVAVTDAYSAPAVAPVEASSPETVDSTQPDDGNITSAYATATDFNEAGSAVLDSLKCSQWLRIDDETKEQAAQYYLLGLGDPDFATNSGPAAEAVTTGCQSYGDRETPKHIVATVWKAYQAGGGG